MKINNSLVEDFGGFTLDTSAIGLRSIDKKNIKLPYNGALPEQMSPVSNAYVYINVQLAQGVRTVLVAERENGKTLNYSLAVSSEELLPLLDGFFEQPHKDTGLSGYWLGLWQAHYIEWRRVMKWPSYILDILSTLPEKDRRFLQKHITDETTAA